jgi:hypothetical protein
VTTAWPPQVASRPCAPLHEQSPFLATCPCQPLLCSQPPPPSLQVFAGRAQSEATDTNGRPLKHQDQAQARSRISLLVSVPSSRSKRSLRPALCLESTRPFQHHCPRQCVPKRANSCYRPVLDSAPWHCREPKNILPVCQHRLLRLFFFYVDGNRSRQEQPEGQIQRPWLGLAKGYLSEAASLKPLRPPKSRKRLSEVRNNVVSTYLTDSEVSQFMGHVGTPNFQRGREPAMTSVVPNTPQKNEREESSRGRKHMDDPLATSTPRDRQRQATAQRNKDPQYRQHRRSQSVPVLSLEDNRETVKRSSTTVISQRQEEINRTGLDRDEAAQYAYGDRQSHGYLYGDLQNLENNADFAADHVMSRPPPIRYHSNESTTLCGSDLEVEPEPEPEHEPEQVIRRQATPPMTPDDTLSSMGTNLLRNRSISPPRLRLNVDAVPPETPAKPTIYVEDEDALYRAALQTRRNVNASQDQIDTPATGIKSADFSILRPPPISIPSQTSVSQLPKQVPPSPVRHASLAVPRNMVPPRRSRQAESDSELTIPERRRTRTGKNSGELRLRLLTSE